MKKVLILEGNLVKDPNISYTHATLNILDEYLLNSKEYEVQRYDLNTTHSETYLTKNNIPNYWNEIDADFWINKLKETDLLILSSSMVNFASPVVVKNFIDSICVADKTFSYKYSKKGDAIGLLTNLSVILITSQGAPEGWYQWGNHKEWLKGTFNFLGAKSIKTLSIDGTKVKPISDIKPIQYAQDIKEKLIELIK
ncbi:FMN-dependent NADH-azoreductase [Mycoplasmopsis felis]|uniref:FMN-dependent NADH-azoreductase n=1 Tax=Mycoplasmopsis felis TaxID=33923 RepID=UPI002B000092|nr:FMN-dependent NADH-azoreductase [Mycoplasmopsis felis]WQQ06220.1 FMN-dependent NADH-azoreductase [Mycoplasmopsis felis]